MINLLPSSIRESYRYGRRNKKLLPWIVVLVLALVGLVAISVYGSISLNVSSENYQKQITASQRMLQKQHVAKVKSQVNSISSSLKLTVQVLGREVLFSKLLEQISAVIPNGVNLTGLNINQAEGAIDVNAVASSYQAATQLQANLTDPDNQIFSKADLVSVSLENGSSSTDSAHPYSVQIRALLGDNKQYLFINEDKK